MFHHHGQRLNNAASFQQLYTARFVPMFLHLMLLIFIFVYREDLVQNCASHDYAGAPNGYVWSDAWTGVSLGLVVVEMVLALSGLSIFRYYPIFFSIVLHSAASVLLSAYFMSNMSICTGSPYLLFFCTFVPLVIELISWLELYGFNKRL